MMIRQVNKYKRGYVCNGTQKHTENNETEEGPQKEANTLSNNLNTEASTFTEERQYLLWSLER